MKCYMYKSKFWNKLNKMPNKKFVLETLHVSPQPKPGWAESYQPAFPPRKSGLVLHCSLKLWLEKLICVLYWFTCEKRLQINFVVKIPVSKIVMFVPNCYDYNSNWQHCFAFVDLRNKIFHYSLQTKYDSTEVGLINNDFYWVLTRKFNDFFYIWIA